MTAQQFVQRFLIASFILLAIIGAFNRVVDPFWYYRDSEIDGFNAIKTKFSRFERDVKPALLVREQAQAIILGSSYSEIGLDPDHPDFTQQGQLKSMNFALAGAVWERVQCEFEFAIQHAPIKRAVVGIFLGTAMPHADCAKQFSNIGTINSGELLFSSRALIASVQTIKGQKTEQPSHTRSGMYFYTRGTAGVDQRFREEFALQTMANPKCLQTVSNNYQEPQALSAASFDISGLQHVINLAKQQGVELVLYIYPHHANALELEQQCGTQLNRWQAMLQLAQLNANVPIWYFDGYNSMMAEPIASLTTYWQDAAHFNYELGNILLTDMFSGKPPSLGHLLNAQTLNEQYRQFLQQRTEYLHAHTEFQTNLQTLLKP